jgi:ribosomal protein L37AE/L43A
MSGNPRADTVTGQELIPASCEQSTSTLLAVAPKLQAFATCPSCHTTDTTMTNDAVEAGADWQCGRCGQTWNAVRLATAAAYALGVSGRNDAGLEVTP